MEKPTPKQRATAKARGPGRPFKKGQSGNPHGRPREVASIKRRLREILTKNPGELEDLTQALIANAKTDARYFKLAIEYLDGKVPDIVRIEEHTIELLPPGVARGPHELADGDDDPDPSSEPDPPTTPSS